MDDLLSVAKQLENLNPKTPLAPAGGGLSRSPGKGHNGPGKKPPENRGMRGISSIRVEAVLSRLMSKVDSRVVGLMASMPVSGAAGDIRIELALLVHLRAGLVRHIGEVPPDVSICETLNEAVQHAEQSLTELQSGEWSWALRMVTFLRERCSLAQALGVAPDGVREQLKSLRKSLQEQESVIPEGSVEQLMTCFDVLQKSLQAQVKPGEMSLLDHVASRP
jgi:hypothetical protein